MNNKLLNYFEDGYNMEKKYSTEQLIKFSEDIELYWVRFYLFNVNIVILMVYLQVNWLLILWKSIKN